jgi:hypothetical protein
MLKERKRRPGKRRRMPTRRRRRAKIIRTWRK